MKVRQLKKALSIVVASSMLVASVPAEALANEQNSTEQINETESGKKSAETNALESSQQKETSAVTKNTEAGETDASEQSTEVRETEESETESQKSEAVSTENPSVTEETNAEKESGSESETPASESEQTTDHTRTTESSSQTEAIPEETASQTDETTETPETLQKSETETTDNRKEAAESKKPNKVLKKSKEAESQTLENGGDAGEQQTVSVKWMWENGEPSKGTFVWDGTTNYAPTPTADNVELELKLTKDGVDVNEAIEPGSYTATATVKDENNNNVKLDNNVINFEVTKEIITEITWNLPAEPLTYTGKPITLPRATFQSADGNNHEVNVDVSQEDQDALVEGAIVNAGVYTLVASLPEGLAEHYIIQSGSESQKIEVYAKKVSIEWVGDGEVVYDGKPHTYSVTTDKQEYSGDIEVVYKNNNVEVKAPENAGTYVAEARIPDDNYIAVNNTKDLTIHKMPVDVEWNSLTVTYNGELQKPKASFRDVSNTIVTCNVEVDGDTSEGKLGVVDVKEDGYKVVVAEGDYSKNYELRNSENIFKITPLEVVVMPDDEANTICYGQPIPKFVYGLSDEYQPVSDTLTREVVINQLGPDLLCCNAEVKGVGNYPLDLAESYNPNYKVALGKESFLTVERLPITVTAVKGDANSKTYNYPDPDEYAYNVSLPEGLNDNMTPDRVKKELKEENIALFIRQDKGQPDGEDVGWHDLEFQATEEILTNNYIITEGASETEDFYINQQEVEVQWDKTEVVYNGQNQKPEAYIVDRQDNEIKFMCEVSIKDYPEGAIDVRENGESYIASVKQDQYPNYKFVEGTTEHEFVITPLELTLRPNDTANTIYYGQTLSDFSYDLVDYQAGEGSVLTEEKVKEELGAGILVREGSSQDSGSYPLSLKDNYNPNYSLTLEEGHNFVIKQLPVTVTAVKGGVNSKYYGGDDPAKYDYTIEIADEQAAVGNSKDPETMKSELSDVTIFERPDKNKNENAGEHDLTLVTKATKNYTITGTGTDAFEIKKLPVAISPEPGQEKIFGEKEPSLYAYSVGIDRSKTNLTRSDVKKELGDYAIQRNFGEAIGTYKYTLIPETSNLYTKTNYDNFDLTVMDESFRIKPIEIVSVQDITSRQDSFDVTINLIGPRQEGVETRVKVEAVEFPDSKDGITFSKNIDDYITNATSGISWPGISDKVRINKVTYQKERKDNGKNLKWDGYLPAGTTIKISVVDAAGNTVSAAPKTIKVTPVNVSFDWSAYETSATTGNYVVANNVNVKPLSLNGDRTGEWVEVLYSVYGNRNREASYGKMNFDFTPEINNAGLQHVSQSVTANIVDTLNLVCESKSLEFYVDDSAFAIPSSDVQFENRGEEVTVRLPEIGTVQSVSIPGGDVKVSGEMGQEFTFPVSWSGEDLIKSGSEISVEYTDQAGHQGTGSATVSRSSVSTPITFSIRPALNEKGFLNGRSDTLIISGSACSCEPIQVNVAGMTKETYADQKEVWSDSNGSWEVLIDMNSLPENEEFTISAEYVDVSGAGHSITAKFDAFCASPSAISPIYEAMTHISGMVEPNTSVALVINGDQQDYYEMKVDRFGHFSYDDVPMMFGGMDSFDIYVTDIAGNVKMRHYDIPEPGDPFEVTSQINPLGKMFYSAEEEGSTVEVATPVSLSDFEEGKDSIELPLLMGMSYEVGTFTIQKSENGIKVSSAIQMNEGIPAEDYSIANDKLYVYTSRPGIEELKNHTGEEYQEGQEISLSEGETIWLVSEKDMTILGEDMSNLDLFDYDSSEAYVNYQEQ